MRLKRVLSSYCTLEYSKPPIPIAFSSNKVHEGSYFFRICNVKKRTQSTKCGTCDTVLPKPAPKYNTFGYLGQWFM